MKKLLIPFLTGLTVCFSWPSNSNAVPDPRDSVIIETKTVTIGQNPVTVRVFITNKDTLTGFELSLVLKSISGGAYMRLSYPREFGGSVRPLDSSLHSFSIVADFLYDGTSPDTFTAAGFRNPANPSTNELPNLARKAFLELKFDSLRPNTGIIEIDSALVWVGASINRVGFVSNGREIDVNFAKGQIFVQLPPSPPWCFDANNDEVLTLTDYVWAANCMFGYGICDRIVTISDLSILLASLFPSPSPLLLPVPCKP